MAAAAATARVRGQAAPREAVEAAMKADRGEMEQVAAAATARVAPGLAAAAATAQVPTGTATDAAAAAAAAAAWARAVMVRVKAGLAAAAGRARARAAAARARTSPSRPSGASIEEDRCLATRSSRRCTPGAARRAFTIRRRPVEGLDEGGVG